jgi:hypothetical protein
MARLAGKTGNVYVGVTTIEDCEDVWNEQVDADVTASLDTSDYKVGSGSAKFICAAGIANGDIVASEAISSTDLTGCTAVMFWAKSTVNITTAGDLQLLIDEDALCANPLALDIPALVANTWKFCRITADFTDYNAAISVGLKLTANDPGAFTLNIDHIQAAKAVAGIKSWKIDQIVDVVDTTGFDSSSHRTFLPVLHGWSGSFEGYKDGAPLTHGSVVGLELQQSATATQQYRGTAIITGAHPSVSVDGLNLISYDFQGVGPIEIATA